MKAAPIEEIEREVAWLERQRLATRGPILGLRPGAGNGRYNPEVSGLATSKHRHPLYWRGEFAGWRFHTKPSTTKAQRRATRRAQRAARRANR